MRTRALCTELSTQARKRFVDVLAERKPWHAGSRRDRAQAFKAAWHQAQLEAAAALALTEIDVLALEVEVVPVGLAETPAPADPEGG